MCNEPKGDCAADAGDEKTKREKRAREPDLITISLVRVEKRTGKPRRFILHQLTRFIVAHTTPSQLI